jgi:hypothetical protein
MFCDSIAIFAARLYSQRMNPGLVESVLISQNESLPNSRVMQSSRGSLDQVKQFCLEFPSGTTKFVFVRYYSVIDSFWENPYDQATFFTFILFDRKSREKHPRHHWSQSHASRSPIHSRSRPGLAWILSCCFEGR